MTPTGSKKHIFLFKEWDLLLDTVLYHSASHLFTEPG